MSGQGRYYSVEDYSLEDWCQVIVDALLWRTGVRSR